MEKKIDECIKLYDSLIDKNYTEIKVWEDYLNWSKSISIESDKYEETSELYK